MQVSYSRLAGRSGIKGFIDYVWRVALAAGGARLDIEHRCVVLRLKIYFSRQ